jgi:hypothetical protein
MTSPNDSDAGRRSGEIRPVDPENAATDPRAAAQQDQIKADHEALQQSARRVESSVQGSARDTAATDPAAAALQDRTKADHDRLQESARRVESSVPADVRDTPIQPANTTIDEAQLERDLDAARRHADEVREAARRLHESVPEERDRDRR